MLKNELEQFYGTEQYHQVAHGVVMTDGVKYFGNKTNAYELILDIAVNTQTIDKLKNEDFIVVKTHKNKNDKIVATYEDGNCNKLYEYTYPSLKLPDDGKFNIWVEYNVILLPSEH